MTSATHNTPTTIPRPPIVAVMGHIDHGKSTLLDYIRKTQTTQHEAGGITQSISAYEVVHEHEGKEKRITFLDTPGHEAFQEMRARGSSTADIAILVVSAEEGVKPQTLEALAAITRAGIPYVIALTKIDKPRADIERAKMSLLEHHIYLEGMGGDIPYVAVSAKSGEGIDDLLDMILLVAELEALTTDPNAPGEGEIIEAHRDPKRGISATIVLLNGTLAVGAYVVAGGALAPVRSMITSLGKKIDRASASTPVLISGFSSVPSAGTPCIAVPTKKEAEERAAAQAQSLERSFVIIGDTANALATIPVVIKAEAFGSIDAIIHELKKLENDRVAIKILLADVGAISEGDAKLAASFPHALIAGFNVGVDARAKEVAERAQVAIGTFDIIYHLAEWLSERIKERSPTKTIAESLGRAKVLKYFSETKGIHLIGARVLSGTIVTDASATLLRGGESVATLSFESLQQGKSKAHTIEAGEFGAQVTSDVPPTPGDEIEVFRMVTS